MFTYRITTAGHTSSIPIKVWMDRDVYDKDKKDALKKDVYRQCMTDQIENLSMLPFAFHHIVLV